jgi:hypothetical protein
LKDLQAMRTTTGADLLIFFQADLALGAKAIVARGTFTVTKRQLLTTAWTRGNLYHVFPDHERMNNPGALSSDDMDRRAALRTLFYPGLQRGKTAHTVAGN